MKIKQIIIFSANLPPNSKSMSMLEQSSGNSNMICLEGKLQLAKNRIAVQKKHSDKILSR